MSVVTHRIVYGFKETTLRLVGSFYDHFIFFKSPFLVSFSNCLALCLVEYKAFLTTSDLLLLDNVIYHVVYVGDTARGRFVNVSLHPVLFCVLYADTRENTW